MVSSYGWSIIVLAFIVKIFLYPVSIYAEKLKKQEFFLQQTMRPKISKLKEKYSGEVLHNKVKNLYGEFNYHPIYSLKTSLGLFVQVPFFIAAYSYFGSQDELDNIPFYLIQNLAQPDRVLIIENLTINMLPIIMTVISFGATYLYGLRHHGLQTKELYFIAIVFLVLLYNEPSSLLLYWTANNIFSLIEAINIKGNRVTT
jgi:YidC/Oxa1 family membrane protein insertase